MTDPHPQQRAPYPGLRAFRREETDLFFGREDCTNAMVDRLAATRFLAVLGSSGTGKSSLVRTGLLDALELGLMAKAGSRWKIVDFRPGGSPLKNLARRLLETEHGEETTDITPQDVDMLRAFLARGPRAIIEWCAGHLPKDGNLLLLVDQFEELFRYQDYAGREEAEAFVALLIESAREKDARIYVTITMRSEFLGACALIEGLSDAINAGMFLTPRMTREHCRDAIVGPAEVCDIDIEPALVNRLLNDLANFAPWDSNDANDQLDRLTRRADQLPLLQYTLNRMWQRAHERSPGTRVKLAVPDYEAIEGLSGALNAHANQIFANLGKQRAQVAEWMFRALTAGSTIADAVRRPTRLDDLISACGGDEAGVRAVVDAFRAPGVNFLMPEVDPHSPKLALDTYIDISHESLIRQWKKLSEWLEKEGRAAQQWRRLVDRFGTGEMVRGRELANLIAWRTETKPNAAWAKRYGGDYPAVIAFLDKSQRAQNNKRMAAIASTIGAFLLVGGFGVYAIVQRNTIAEQSSQLEQRLAETQAERTRTVAERERAESNKRQVLVLIERVIVLGGASDDDPATPMVARRVPDASLAGARGETTSDGEADNQPSADRATTQAPEAQNPALAAAIATEQMARQLAKNNPGDNEIRRLLVVALNHLGNVNLRNNPVGKEDNLAPAERAYNESLGVAREMLKIVPEDRQVELKDDSALALVGLARVKMRRSDHDGARGHLEEAVAIERELSNSWNDRDPRVLRNLQNHLGQLGDTYINLKMPREAFAAFKDRLDFRRKRLARNEKDTQLMLEVSVALDRVGQLLRDADNTGEARKHFDEALQIDRALYKGDTGRRQWQENLVLSLNRIGDLDRQSGEYREALRFYEEALPLQRRLAAGTGAVAAQATLALMHRNIGESRRRLREYPAAIRAHRDEVDIRRKLLAPDPKNFAARRNLSTALDYLGNTLRDSGDRNGARESFAEELKIDRGIAADERGTQSLTDLAWSLGRIGDIDFDDESWSNAAGNYEEAVGIQRELIAPDPESPVRMRALAAVVSKLGQARSRLKDDKAALALHQEELGLRTKLFDRAPPSDTEALRDLSRALDRVGNVLRDTNDHRGAFKYFEKELEMDRSFVQRLPQSLTALGDLQWTLNKIGDFVRLRLSDRMAARKYFEEMIGVDRRLIDLQRTNKARYTRLKDDLTKLANLLLELSDSAGARANHGEAHGTTERWLAIARQNFKTTESDADRSELVQALGDAGWNALLAGRAADAIPLIQESLSMSPDTPWNTVNLAHGYLFQGRYDDAIKLYGSVRTMSRGQDSKRTYADEIKDDFGVFRRLGLAPPALDRAERELKL